MSFLWRWADSLAHSNHVGELLDMKFLFISFFLFQWGLLLRWLYFVQEYPSSIGGVMMNWAPCVVARYLMQTKYPTVFTEMLEGSFITVWLNKTLLTFITIRNVRTPKSRKHSYTKLYVATISAQILYLGIMFYAYALVLTFIILHYIQKANIELYYNY